MIDSDGRPLHVRWDYTRAEMVADAVVHGIGIAFAVIGERRSSCLTAVFAGGAQLAAGHNLRGRAHRAPVRLRRV
jgi:hypothetical protein